MNKKVIIIGASGHGKVVADIIIDRGDTIVGFLDDGKIKGTKVLNYEVLGTTLDIENYKDCEFVIAIGNNKIRKMIAERYQVNYYTAIHPSAFIGFEVDIEEGTVVMPYAIINSSTKIGKHCIINSGAIVEHDNVLADYVHISPNATLCGTVHVGELTHVGASATIKNNTTITSNTVIGAGSVVVKNIDIEGTYVGVPARVL